MDQWQAGDSIGGWRGIPLIVRSSSLPNDKLVTWTLGTLRGVGKGVRGPHSPSRVCPIMLSVCLGIKPWGGPGASLLALSSSLVTYVGVWKENGGKKECWVAWVVLSMQGRRGVEETSASGKNPCGKTGDQNVWEKRRNISSFKSGLCGSVPSVVFIKHDVRGEWSSQPGRKEEIVQDVKQSSRHPCHPFYLSESCVDHGWEPMANYHGTLQRTWQPFGRPSPSCKGNPSMADGPILLRGDWAGARPVATVGATGKGGEGGSTTCVICLNICFYVDIFLNTLWVKRERHNSAKPVMSVVEIF